MAGGWLDRMSAQPAEQRQAFRKLFSDVRLEPKEDGPLVEDDTKRKIDRIWKLWEGFCRLSGIDSDRVWEDFLLLRDTATEAIKAFLKGYVQNSTQMRIVLDARERVEEPAVRHAVTVVEVWRALISAADSYVMEHKRRAQPKRARFWRLQWFAFIEGRVRGPAFELVLWIYEQLAPAEGLLTESPYRKVGAKPSDIRTLLLNLWVKAAYIPCTPLTRLYIHVIDLLSGLGGFRPKSLINLTFSQFQLAFVTLPNGTSRLACQCFIERVKQKRRQKCRPRSSKWIEFTLMANPDPLFDLPGLIACLGIARDAFEAGYTSPEDLYTRPLREGAQYIPLNWKRNMLDERIVKTSDTTLHDLWQRTCLVSGARDVPRYYCLRVGAGGRTIGALGEVLHSYIFSNSIDVFKNSYQASLDVNLMELLSEEAKKDRPFLDAQGDLLFRADENAPIDLTPEELAEFERRDDIAALRSQVREAVGRERTLLRDRCSAEVERLSGLLLNDKRAEFFGQIDQHRARGIPTDGIRSRALKEREALSLTNSGAAIAHFLEASDMPSGQARTVRWIGLLLDNLRGTGPGAAAAKPSGFQCLLCERPFPTAFNLTRHTEAMHGDQFSRPFQCPARARCGQDGEITGSEAWSIHCANLHGPSFTPRPVAKSILCFCGRKVPPGMITHHMNQYHAEHSGPASCQECEGSPSYEDLDEWLGHAQTHLSDSRPPFKRCQLCGKVYLNMHRHLTRAHKSQFQQRFPCPKCELEVDGQEAYEAHMLEFHTPRRPSRPPHDERVPDPTSDTSLVTGDGNGRCGSGDTASDTDPANVEAWKLLGVLLSQIDSQGWSERECLRWMRGKVQAMQDGSPTGRVTKKETKRGAPEALGSERIKRPRHVRGLDDTGAEIVVGEDDSRTASDTIEDDDGSDWGTGDDGDCSSDTSADGDEEDPETLATVFQALQGPAASKMAPCAATQNSPPASTPNTVFSGEPPPPYTSRANSPLKRGRLID